MGVYWTKVGAELTKFVAKAEGLAPPSQAEFQSVYQHVSNFIKGKNQATILASRFKSLGTDNTERALKLGTYVVQCVGCFSLGEVIGRRHIVGYPSFGHDKHH